MADQSRDPGGAGDSWRAAAAYLLGFAGGLIFVRSPRTGVRFHAIQSILIDVAAAVYSIASLVVAGAYASIRYPGKASTIPPDDVVMWTWAVTSVLGPLALHVVLALATLTGRSPRVPFLWRVASTFTPVPDTRRKTRSAPQDFNAIWTRIALHEGQDFRLRHGGLFHYQLYGDEILPNRTTIGIHRSHFERAWNRRPLTGPGRIGKDVIGPSYVYAILTDPRITL
ncbi:hypothetical protein J5X84_14380 [Streptosporangiaceae bacterium NEAU-GS5]|nr:hypothetical protein [Streptosporangiaceae bacterium NEAU-GS5]